MKRSNISANVIRRLPRYLRKFDDLLYHGAERISSAELGRQMGLTSSQIRQDFSCFGEFGQQGYGYNIQSLRNQIAEILGMKAGFRVILVGVGNLGHTLIESFGFDRNGFSLLAAFDVDPDIIGTELSGVKILAMSTLREFCEKNKVDIAVLATPKRAANKAAVRLVEMGIPAIWNFTNIEIDPQSPNVLVENIHFSDSLLTLSYYLLHGIPKEDRDG